MCPGNFGLIQKFATKLQNFKQVFKFKKFLICHSLFKYSKIQNVNCFFFLVPTNSPSTIPSNAPTMDCNYLVVSECNLNFDDIYKRSRFSTNGKASYDSFHISSSRVFRQGNFWIINRVGYENYLIAEFEESDLYPIMKSWNLTNDDTNFMSELKTCVVICRSNMFPTVSPSFEPSANPSMEPTFFTNVPSIAPTDMPTSTPSHAPTSIPTKLPSVVPSVQPTYLPTDIPTRTPSILPTVSGTWHHVMVFVFHCFFLY